MEARLGTRVLNADELLRDGFCLSLPASSLPPMQVLTDLDEALLDSDIVVNALPLAQTREIFARARELWAASRYPVVISLSKGVEEGRSGGKPSIVTATQTVHEACGVPLANLLHLGGPNIALEIWNGNFATARLCGSEDRLRRALANFLSTPDFAVWDGGSDISVSRSRPCTLPNHGSTAHSPKLRANTGCTS